MPSIPSTPWGLAAGPPAPTASAWPILSAAAAAGSGPPRAVQQHHEYQEHRQAAFQALRPVTTQLLLLRDQPERLQPQLLALRQLLQELPREGVEACWDYAAFPLLVLVDAVVSSRQSVRPEQGAGGGGAGGDGAAAEGGNSGGGPGRAAPGELVAAACRSDRVVEALLGALLDLLERSPLTASPLPPSLADLPGQLAGSSGGGSGGASGRAASGDGTANDRLVSVLQHLAPLMQLGRDEASEEVSIALQRCTAAALAPMAAVASSDGGGGCARAVLCSEEVAPLAGYLLHSCLEVSEREVLAGHKGSKALCAAALSTLGVLLAALPDPDVMAFFLPGVVSSLSKHLYAAGTAAATSGPSAPPGAAATVQALTCLRTAAVTVLSDESTAALLGPDSFVGGGGGSPTSAGVRRAEDALSVLKQLSRGQNAAAAAAAPVAAVPATAAPAAAAVAAAGPGSQQRRRLRVERTRQWLEETGGRLDSLLSRVLPPLCSHPRPAVRSELAVTVAALLDGCGRALAPSQPLLLQLLFTLAQDEWRQVAAPCLDWVARRAPPQVAAAPTTAAAEPPLSGAPSVPATGDVGGGSGGGSGDGGVGVSGRAADGGGGGGTRQGGHTSDLRALEDEFERFMQDIMSESVLLNQPALELDERELYGGLDDGAGGRDQGAPPPAPAPCSGAGATADATAIPGAAVSTASASTPAAAVAAAAPPPPALPGLQQLIAESATSVYLMRAVRVGEAEAIVRARCLTTALLVAGPGRVAEWLLLRPAALSDLLAGLFRCFAFDRNAATLILHLRGEAGSYAPSVAAAGGTASAASAPAVGPATAAAAATTSLTEGAAGAVALPRMPLGLLHLASQRSYSALATVARSLGRLARAADLQTFSAVAAVAAESAAAQQRTAAAAGCGGSGVSVLRRLVDELTADLRRAVARGSAGAGAGLASVAAGGGGGKQGRTTALRAAEDDEYCEGAEEQQELGGGDGSGVRRGGGAATAAAGSSLGEGSWQCEAAAVVAVMAEVVIGASNAWVPPLGSHSPSPQQQGAAEQPSPPPPPPFPTDDSAFESVVLGLLTELMRPAIVKLPTHNDSAAGGGGGAGGPWSYDGGVHPDLAAAGTASRRRPLSAASLGENVMLLRGMLEAVGTAARAVGPRFASQGRLLRTVLVPLLELLGDPAPPVAAAADTALQSICAHCGYCSSLRGLLGANADYVVDSLCARLRDLPRHPRAPHLMAALLRRAGVAPQLLPLMAEPLQRTLQGLSPLARHWAPHYAHSYLGVLRELAAGAAAEAAAAGEDSRAAVTELNRLAAEARRSREQAAEAAAAAAGSGADVAGGGESPVPHEEVRRFFMERNAAAAAGLGGEEEGEGEGRRPLLTLNAGQLEDAELRFRRLHAAATVAGSAADAAAPLLMSSDLRAAVAAAEVLHGALVALAASTPAVEAEAAVLEEYGGAEARLRPVRPETPKVLPAVASAWTPLMAALRDSRTPVVERSLVALAELVQAGGGTFLARRFQQEAWPVLQRLLTHGSAHMPGLLSLGTEAARAAPPRRRLEIGTPTGGIVVSGGEDAAAAAAPAAVCRVRVAALRCLEAVCRCREASVAVRTLTWGIAQAAFPFLGSSHPLSLHEAAQAAMLAVAAIDPDGVWLLLYDTTYNMPPALVCATTGRPSGAVAGKHLHHHTHHQPPGNLGAGTLPGPGFPPLRALLPPLPGAGTGRYGQPSSSSSSSPSFQQPPQWPVTAALAADCGPRAQSLLAAVAGLEVPWHATQVPLLEDIGMGS